MLILTRRVGETIVIGDDVVVTVLGIKGNQVRIGINAPKNVSVHREEIYQRIQQEKGGPTSHAGAAGITVEQESPSYEAAGNSSTTSASSTVVISRKKRDSRLDKNYRVDGE